MSKKKNRAFSPALALALSTVWAGSVLNSPLFAWNIGFYLLLSDIPVKHSIRPSTNIAADTQRNPVRSSSFAASNNFPLLGIHWFIFGTKDEHTKSAVMCIAVPANIKVDPVIIFLICLSYTVSLLSRMESWLSPDTQKTVNSHRCY